MVMTKASTPTVMPTFAPGVSSLDFDVDVEVGDGDVVPLAAEVELGGEIEVDVEVFELEYGPELRLVLGCLD